MTKVCTREKLVPSACAETRGAVAAVSSKPPCGALPRQGNCPLCKSFGDFRKAIRCGSIDAVTAKRIFNKHFVRLREICKREKCSMEMARTINAVLECDIDYAFRREGKPGFLKAYDTVETLLEDLKS